MTLFVRRRWPTVVAAVAVLAALVALVVVLAGRDSSSDPVVDDPEIVETAEPVPDPTPEQVAFADVLTASDAKLKTYAEHQVTATSAPVQSVVGPSAIWVGSSTADRVLVVVVSTTRQFQGLKAGDPVTFTGFVRAVAGEFGRSLGLEGADLADFQRQGAYVEVEDYRSG